MATSAHPVGCSERWTVLCTLSSYATTTFPADFTSIRDTHGAEFELTSSLVAQLESPIVDTTGHFLAVRPFPVPIDVDSSGQAYFPAHVRVDRGW